MVSISKFWQILDVCPSKLHFTPLIPHEKNILASTRHSLYETICSFDSIIPDRVLWTRIHCWHACALFTNLCLGVRKILSETKNHLSIYLCLFLFLFVYVFICFSGKTWGPPKSILNNGYIVKEGFMLGSILVDHITNTTFIVYLQCGPAPPNVGCPHPAVHIINSTNDGTTWGKPRNLTDQIGHVTFAPGPGFGIQVSIELGLECRGDPGE